jgi:hypothetical protein
MFRDLTGHMANISTEGHATEGGGESSLLQVWRRNMLTPAAAAAAAAVAEQQLAIHWHSRRPQAAPGAYMASEPRCVYISTAD